MTKELSESLLAACKAAGIEKPGYIAQDANGDVMHYTAMPVASYSCDIWSDYQNDFKLLEHPPYADDWQDSLLEWVEPQGEPLAEVLTQHGDLIGDTTEMVILYDIADTSKMIDDACKLGYRKMIDEYAGRRTEAQVYERAWRDALAWKGGQP